MKIKSIIKIVVGFVSLFTATMVASAAVVVSVDMDTSTPGIIDSSISVAPGASLSVNLWLTVDASGLSSFSISALFDTGELSLNPPAGPAASQPALPGGLINFPPIPAENNALGRVYSFQGGTFGTGPVSTSFIFGSIAFTAPTPLTDGLNDVSVGFFNGGFDDIFNNAGVSVAPTTVFVGGKVNAVPEPASGALLVAGISTLSLRRRHRTP